MEKNNEQTSSEKLFPTNGIINRILNKLSEKLDQSNLNPKQKKTFIFTADILINLVVIVILVVFIRSFIMSPFQVYGSSMCDTINLLNEKCENTYGEFIMINKSSYLNILGWQVGLPQRGDIIVFRPPQNNNEYYIKRVIGLPGETVKLIDGEVYIYNDKHPQGVKLEEPYLNSSNQGNTNPMDKNNTSTFNIPQGQYFVMGDNRKGSSDSRVCFQESYTGPHCGSPGITHYLDLKNIEGKAAIGFWPKPRILETAKYPELE